MNIPPRGLLSAMLLPWARGPQARATIWMGQGRRVKQQMQKPGGGSKGRAYFSLSPQAGAPASEPEGDRSLRACSPFSSEF